MMRHIFLARTPLLLAGRVSARSPGAALVANAGGSQALPSLLLRTPSVAVNMPGIALAANAHRDPAAPALVSPERPLSHRNAILFKDWTMPCGTCIKEPWSCLSHAPHRRPGGRPQNQNPGPSLLRRQALRITKMKGIASIAMPSINRPLR